MFSYWKERIITHILEAGVSLSAPFSLSGMGRLDPLREEGATSPTHLPKPAFELEVLPLQQERVDAPPPKLPAHEDGADDWRSQCIEGANDCQSVYTAEHNQKERKHHVNCCRRSHEASANLSSS